MGKHREQKYDKDALTFFAQRFTQSRKPIEGGKIPENRIDIEKLEKTIKMLPSQSRNALEKFFGLIPGTVKHMNLYARNVGNIAYENMLKNTITAINILARMEYMVFYDSGAKKLCEDVLKKIDRTGLEGMTDNNLIKYYVIFLAFFYNGPKMAYEEIDEEINTSYDKNQAFDEYALLKANWDIALNQVEDGSVNMKLFIELLQMFDYVDVISMKKYERLPLSREDDSISTTEFNTFRDIRNLKERMFPAGPWNITTKLIFNGKKYLTEEEQDAFSEFLYQIRCDWNNLERFKSGSRMVPRVTGKAYYEEYTWPRREEFKWTDTYELLGLYVCSRYFLA